ncbi:hypothetical protein BJ165DRAFT_1428073 [Panaeolus papilionaceus]|nr:hypothetical protein BJ165DRAFT_1428073 [Panaeolus papilionaceus]
MALFISREGFLIATSFCILCIPIYIFSQGQKVFHYYTNAFNEPFEIKGYGDWVIYITVRTGYILLMGMVIFVEYNSLFIPIAAILILRRYFQPNSALIRCFEALVQRYERLQHLVPTDRTIGLISARFSELISTGIALNAIINLTFCLAGALAMFSAALGLALFLFIPLRIESTMGSFMIGSMLILGYCAFTVMSSLRRRILAFCRVGVSVRNTQTPVGLV